jgi:hypothetical protein
VRFLAAEDHPGVVVSPHQFLLEIDLVLDQTAVAVGLKFLIQLGRITTPPCRSVPLIPAHRNHLTATRSGQPPAISLLLRPPPSPTGCAPIWCGFGWRPVLAGHHSASPSAPAAVLPRSAAPRSGLAAGFRLLLSCWMIWPLPRGAALRRPCINTRHILFCVCSGA